jgi:hypothetical protein
MEYRPNKTLSSGDSSSESSAMAGKPLEKLSFFKIVARIFATSPEVSG